MASAKKTPGTLDESPAQHVRNAMTILSAWAQQHPELPAVCVPRDEFEAAYARLSHAVMMLENRVNPLPRYPGVIDQ